MYTISPDIETGVYYVMLDNIDVAIFNTEAEAQQHIDQNA